MGTTRNDILSIDTPGDFLAAMTRRSAIVARASAIVASSLLVMVIGGADPARAEADDLEARQVEAAYRFSLGKLQAETGAFSDALESLLTARELDGSDAYVHLALAELHADMADSARSRETRTRYLADASEHAAAAYERAPENTDILRTYARIHFTLGESQPTALRRAREAFESLREKDRADLQVLVSLGQIYLVDREYGAAADALREAASQRPGNRMIERMLLDALLGSGALAEAEPLLAKQLEAEPESIDRRFQLSEVYARLGDNRRAADVLASAPPALRSNPAFRRRLAISLHQAGREQEALQTIESLIAGGVDDSEILRLRVAVLSALTRYEDALEALQAWQPTEEEARLQRTFVHSRLLERLGRTDEAVDVIEKRLGSDDDASGSREVQILLGLVSVLERAGRGDEAIARLKVRLEDASGEEIALLARSLAEIHARAGAHERAAEVYADAAGRVGDDSRIIRQLDNQRLNALANAEQWARVIPLARALASEKDGEGALAAKVILANAQAETGELDAALATLDSAVEQAPDAGRQVLAQRVGLLFDHERVAEGEALIAEVADSGERQDLLFAAQLWQRQQRWLESLALIEQAEAADPQPPSVGMLFARAVAHERQGEFGRAAMAFETLLERSPDHAPTLNYLGYMWADRGEHLDRALTLIQRAVALDPDNGAYVDSLGWAHFKLGNFDSARQLLEWAARLMTSDPTIYEHLGDVYTAMRQPDRARDSYLQAIERGADDSEAIERKIESLDEAGTDSTRETDPTRETGR